MRAIVRAAAPVGAILLLFSALFSVLGAEAFAQSSAAYPYCLMTGPAQSCFYNSMAQCLASKRGNADFCEPNNWYSGQAGRYRR
ncbi:MAG: DUF3551 domain-containing protein [Xanthobacteraceae bacterium]